MNDDIDRINAEIDRLALKTTDPKPMQLFVEREKLRKRAQMWKLGMYAAAILGGAISFIVFFANDEYGAPEACIVAFVAMAPVALLSRRDIRTRGESWLARARQVVGE